MKKLVLATAVAMMPFAALAAGEKVETFAQDIKISGFTLGADVSKHLDGVTIESAKPVTLSRAVVLACKLDKASAQCAAGSKAEVTKTVKKPNQKFSVIAKDKGVYASVLAGHAGLSKRVDSMLLTSKGFTVATCNTFYDAAMKSFSNKGYKFVSADVVEKHGLVANMTGNVANGDVVSVRVFECVAVAKDSKKFSFKVNLKSAKVAKHNEALSQARKFKAVDAVFDVK